MNKRTAAALTTLACVVGLLASCVTTGRKTMEPGLPVNKIPFADRISDWQAVDKRHLVVSTSPSRSYLLTLRRECHTLSFANRLGVSSSNNTVYAGFDYVTSDGQRCAIQRINEITNDERKALTGA